MPNFGNNASRSSRIVGPTLATNTPLTDDSYSVYGLHYCDYLRRITVQDTDRPYVTPPQFPQGKAITATSQQYHRRLYAMYMDVATRQLPDPSVPGYCYMIVLPPDKSRDISQNLGPYPTMHDVRVAMRLCKAQTSISLVRQVDGTLHVVQSANSDAIHCDLAMLEEKGVDINARVGGCFKSIDRPILAVRTKGWGVFAQKLQVGIQHVTSEYKSLDFMGRWRIECTLPEGHLLMLDPGQNAAFDSLIVGSDELSTSVYAMRETHFSMLSPIVVPGLRDRDPTVAWSSSWRDEYAYTFHPIKCNVVKLPPMDIYPKYSTDWWFTEKDEYFFFDPTDVPELQPAATSEISITDPLDDWSPVQETRYQAVLNTCNSPLRKISAGWVPVKLTAFRARGFDGHLRLNKCLKILSDECTIVLLSSVHVWAHIEREYHDPELSFRTISAGCDMSYDMSYGDSD